MRGSWEPLHEKDIAFVTGGSRGLGLEIVKLLLLKKVTVVIVDIEEPEQDIKESVHFFECDIACQDDLMETIQKVQTSIGKISLLVNNAGVRHKESLMDLKPNKIQRIFNINTFSHITSLQSIIPKVTSKDRLFIVTISSILGILGPANLSIYSATKSSVIQIHESLSHELQDSNNIRMLLVTPGQLDTIMFSDVNMNNPLAPVVSCRTLAQTIVEKMNNGERGNLSNPIYANFLPVMKVIPYHLSEVLRKFSGMDEQIKS